jgi:hypothetical protein
MARIKLLRNKRDLQIKQLRKEIAQLLTSGQEPSAHIRVSVFTTSAKKEHCKPKALWGSYLLLGYKWELVELHHFTCKHAISCLD